MAGLYTMAICSRSQQTYQGQDTCASPDDGNKQGHLLQVTTNLSLLQVTTNPFHTHIKDRALDNLQQRSLARRLVPTTTLFDAGPRRDDADAVAPCTTTPTPVLGAGTLPNPVLTVAPPTASADDGDEADTDVEDDIDAALDDPPLPCPFASLDVYVCITPSRNANLGLSQSQTVPVAITQKY
ncbi:uncharacterized protein PSANT_01108 [Moesziomyces antarcticus]|uniref:Uncharacterized protein n=1 Tax=Pseudozyma antarctica TaxID=84753 RepID=A0A5C3FGA2_PSEA2|nr:uncharacterized protein PSANT_01108 [Moesziomyces antarcticus]